MKRVRKYRYPLPHGKQGVCGLIYDKDTCVVIAFEFSDTPGINLMDHTQDVANQVCEEYHLDKRKLIWIEWQQKFSRVKFKVKQGRLVSPTRSQMNHRNLASYFK